MANERKLNNYTVIYGVYECEFCGREQLFSSGCKDCHFDETPNVPATRQAHVKAKSLADASSETPGRFIAAFEGHITGLLG